MKEIPDYVKTLIRRYLSNEASEADFIEIAALIEQHPSLLQQLKDGEHDPHTPASDDFDAPTAFRKLDERFKNEGLI